MGAYSSELMAAHRCDGCSGSDRLADEVEPFCEACGFARDAHQRASECPDEAEVREWWGR